ncbi:MAG: putative Holliday junction resolvase, partial [Flavobacteriales bacterium]
DESFSSRDAMSAMLQGGMKKAKRQDKKNLDMVSAAVILQRYLESK